MRWVGLVVVVVAVSSVALVSQGQGPKPDPAKAAPYSPAYGQPASDLLPPPPLPAAPATAWAPMQMSGPMVVKVYAVPDLVAVTQPAGSRLPFGGDPEMAAVMQQVAAQVQAQVAAQVGASDPHEPVAKNLERLKKALRIAAPKRSWEEGGGEGEIEIYPDTLSLIIRQSPEAHTAIADLLTQLRATQDVLIELNVEVLSLETSNDPSDTPPDRGPPVDSAAADSPPAPSPPARRAATKSDENMKTIMGLLGKELSPEEAAKFRSACGEGVGPTLVRVPNGQTAAMGGILSQYLGRVMAVARADRSLVEFRIEFPFLDAEMGAMAVAGATAHTVSIGKTMAVLPLVEGEMVLLVTPKVVDRTAAKPQ